MFKRLLITFAVATLGCALVSCGDSGAGSDKPLQWRMAVDVPVNFTMPVNESLPSAPLLPDVDCEDLPEEPPYRLACEELPPDERKRFILTTLSEPSNPDDPALTPYLPDSYVVDVDSGTISTKSDVIDILRKLTDTRIQYSITATNYTKVALAFYGMFFRADDTAAMKCSVDVFYNDYIKTDNTDSGRVNMFGSEGLFLRSKDSTSYPAVIPPDTLALSDSLQGRRLGDLIIRQKAFSYRWLVKLDDISGLGSASENSDSIVIKLRIRFSGVNSMDSLFTL